MCSFSSSRLWARMAASSAFAGGVDPLVVPVDGLQLLPQRGVGPVPVDGGRPDEIQRFVETFAGHSSPSSLTILVAAFAADPRRPTAPVRPPGSAARLPDDIVR